MEEINLQELFDYFKSKIILILVIMLVVLIAGNIYSIFIRKPLYSSETTVLLVAEDNKTYNNTDLTFNQNLVSTYSEIIKSRKILNEVIGDLGLKYSYSELSDMVSVSSVEDTEIIKIRVNSENAREAKRIADEIANEFSREVRDKFKLSNVSILDYAVVAKRPFNENYMKDNLIYILISLVISFVVIFLMFYFDTTIKNSDTLESKYGFTVMGIVPLVRGEKR